MRTLLALCLLLAVPAWADEAPAQAGTLVSLSATAETLLGNDELVVAYRIEATGKRAAGLQDTVNGIARKVKAVLDRQGETLKRQTTGRSLQSVTHYDKASGRQVHDGWRLVQNEQVTSMNLDTVTGWVDDIEQAGAHLDRLAFGLSARMEKTALDALRMQAVLQFRARAADMAEALDASSFRIVRLRSEQRMPPSPVLQRGVLAMAARDAAPVLHAGESRLSVTVSGDILLPDKSFRLK